MKFTLSWLKEHLDTEATLGDIAEALTDLGLEVEDIVDPADRLGDFRIGFVREAAQHPDADRLRVCQVETADGVKQIICGAPNARAGIHVVIAEPGAYVPGIDTTIGVGKIRGVESFGMMCSEKELELSDEHDGIIEVPGAPEIGARYIDVADLNDPTIEIGITPNRPDALGVAGIARDLAARGLGRVTTPAIEPVPGSFPCPIPVTLGPGMADGPCPHFCGRLVRGVTNGPSPAWLQRKLRAIGLRPISALVDITNLLTFDRGRPLHAFDAAKVSGGLTVRAADTGESLVALDGKTYELDPRVTVIADANGVESIGGIMGGEASGCTEATTDVFLEAAFFDPIRTAETGRKLRINSDARYRFERGIDPAFTRAGLEMATRLVLDICGGAASEVLEVGAPIDTARSYTLRPERTAALVGMDIPAGRQTEILGALGFEVSGTGPYQVAVPSWRPDVHGEADLVEEVARVASLTKLQGKPLPRTDAVAPKVLTPLQVRIARGRRTLAAAGLNECLTYSFIDQASAALFGGGTDATLLANPISSEMSHMRPSMLPGLLQAAARNQARGFADLALFETGPVFEGGEPGEETVHLSALRVGHAAPRDAFGSRRPVDAFDARADALDALTAMGAPSNLMTVRSAPDWLHPGRSAVLSLGPKTPLAMFGEIHPAVLSALDVKGPAVAAVVLPAAIPLPRNQGPARAALHLDDLQAVDRDFAFVVDARMEAEQVLRAARGADKALIAGVSLFDVFEGDAAEAQMGPGKKSVAIAVRLQPKTATLTEAEIEATSAKIIAAVQKVGGALRT